MADTFKMISNISFILAAIFLLVAVFMFFKFNIRKIVGDLSGRNARKSISAMKQDNPSGEVSNVNYIYKREIKETFSELQTTSEMEVRTESLNENKSEIVTDVLDETINTTTVLSENVAGTTVLGQNEVGTTVLSNAQLMPKEKQFIVRKEITFMHGAVSLSNI